jgi:hypothetical protein
MPEVKNSREKYGHLALKDMDQNQGNTICVDLIGPYMVQTKYGKEYTLHAFTICDTALGWIEVAEIKNKTPKSFAKILEKTRFCALRGA